MQKDLEADHCLQWSL